MSGGVPIRGQLSRLDRLVAAHETYWAAVAQNNPRSTAMRDFLRQHWDPWFSRWMEARPRLDRRQAVIDATGDLRSQLVPASDNTVAAFVREASSGLSGLRQLATNSGIPTPDLGTARQGFGDAEDPRVAGLSSDVAQVLEDAAGHIVTATHNKLTDEAARGNVEAQEMLALAPELATLATAFEHGPDAFRAAVSAADSAKAFGDEGEQDMNAYAGNYVGAEGQSYPEVASRTVRKIHTQQRSPLYGYIRSGNREKIYLFNLLEDARTWFDQHIRMQPDHDYAAVFSASNLSAPIAGMEHFMRTTVGCVPPYVGSDADVGNWWPFFLGLPLGGAAGYFLRRWQEPESARAMVPSLRDAARPLLAPQAPQAPQAPAPPIGGPWLDLVGQQYGDFGDFGSTDSYGYPDPSVGGPWLDMVGPQVGGPWLDMVGPQVGGPWLDMVGPQVGGPWLDIVGAQTDDARRRSWPQTRALIQSAMDDVKNYVASFPAAEAYVWSLDAPASGPYTSQSGAIITPEGTTNVVPFSSQAEALKYLREVALTKPVALAMFERSSPHWPNPIAWRKSDQPEHMQVIAQHVASRSPTQTSGTYAGADTVIGAAIDDVRRRAQSLADRRAGNVIGVIHTSKDGLWHTLAFRTADDADDWLNTATQDQESYTYAAYFDKEGDSWPAPYIEKIGGVRPARRTGIVGAALDDYRTLAKQHATAKPGRAAGAILNTEGRWRVYGFTSLDDAIDWLQQATREKATFKYAGAFEKDRGGTAYLQDEELGGVRTPAAPGPLIPREIATTSGDWW